MFENAFWKDAIGWAEKTVGTKSRYSLVLFMHLVLGFGSIFVLSLFTYRLFGYYFHPFSVFLFLGMVGLPAVYLFALRKLLLEFKKNNQNKKLNITMEINSE